MRYHRLLCLGAIYARFVQLTQLKYLHLTLHSTGEFPASLGDIESTLEILKVDFGQDIDLNSINRCCKLRVLDIKIVKNAVPQCGAIRWTSLL